MEDPVDIIKINVPTHHTHETLGFIMNKNLKVVSCQVSTPAAKVKGWRQSIKGTVLYKVNNTLVENKTDVIQAIDWSKATTEFHFKSSFQTTVYPETGTT